MYCLYPDVYLTRRQRLHYVMNGDDVLMWSGKSIFSAVAFLIDKEESSFELDAGDGEEKLLLTAKRV